MSTPIFHNAKFEATGETKVEAGVTLYRIRAVAPIAALGVAAGGVAVVVNELNLDMLPPLLERLSAQGALVGRLLK